MDVQHLSDKIWVINNFLSPQKCADLLLFSEHRGYSEATVTTANGARMIKGIRNNDRLSHQDKVLAEHLWEDLKPHCPPVLNRLNLHSLNDHFRFYRYTVDQRFKRHRDGHVQLDTGERSLITFMVYLNDDFEGGETQFDGIVVKPQTGMALCFHHELKHEGCQLTAGEKYVLRSDVFYKSADFDAPVKL